jgi:hypothetical protein
MTPSTPFNDFSYFSSLFLLRKALPASPPVIADYLAKLGREPTVNHQFIYTVRATVPMMFPVGWDANYSKYQEKVRVSRGSCRERSRGNGGARSAAAELFTYDSFLETVLNGHELDPVRKVTQIERDGKIRLVTVASLLQTQLLPLHLMIHDHLSKNKWLLREDAKTSALREFQVKEGEIFVSGDYESATDNFSSAHSREILEGILFHAHNVPDRIKNAALSSLTGKLDSDGVLFDQLTGQLMGNYLSFPLLCLTNFLTLVHALGWERVQSLPLKINGDDIVFRCTPGEADKWASCVSESGLVLSQGKTLRHWRFFSINSTFFCATRKKVRVVPVIRSSVLVKDCSTSSSLAGRLRSFSWGFFGKKRRVMEEFILRWHARTARLGNVSWTRGRRCHLTVHELGRLNLLTREIDLLERRPELDVDPEGFRDLGSLPEGGVVALKRDFCKSCLVNSSFYLQVQQAKMSWNEKYEKVRKEEKPEIVKINRRLARSKLFGCTHARMKKFMWYKRPGMRVLWGRPWLGRKKEKEKVVVFPSQLCSQCDWSMVMREDPRKFGGSVQFVKAVG